MATGRRHVRRRPCPARMSARDLRASRAWEAIAGCYPRTVCATRRNHARWPHMEAGQRPLASRTGLRNAESGVRPCAWNGAAMRDIACGLAPHVICWRRPPPSDNDLRQIVATAEFYF
ncbi:hypothetical protein F511_46658 [Dorcoceras hygrometricum]|uniref:Uncharacterized protein n=1 Tax=Dorcoceras hygrometricum TaxID=472368 RepID=A0A2Z6ZSY8_9LAMI|nr:hypothetical protein F511_46658 [Dorcoceras hygrometricum]